jgi:serine O-acetyltransferase
MSFFDLCQLISSDLHRYTGSTNLRTFVRWSLKCPEFNYVFWLRLVAWMTVEGKPARKVWSPLPRLIRRHLAFKYGISIPPSTKIGPGFYVGHFGGIVVNGRSQIGRDCNISQGVTLGQSNRGPRKGSPVLGDRVFVGPGAKVVGAVRIGSNVAIGANAVVIHDVPDNAVVVGIPAKVVSYHGSAEYINRTDYREPRRPSR